MRNLVFLRPELTLPSRLEGAARRGFSEDSASAVYCAIMNPVKHKTYSATRGGCTHRSRSGLRHRGQRRLQILDGRNQAPGFFCSVVHRESHAYE